MISKKLMKIIRREAIRATHDMKQSSCYLHYAEFRDFFLEDIKRDDKCYFLAGF